MSLLKAFNLPSETIIRDFTDIEVEFLSVIEEITDKNSASTEQLAGLVALYAEYGCAYMCHICDLAPNDRASANMKIMNSYLAEVCRKAGSNYYHKEEGYTLVDKAVQEALNNRGRCSVEKALEFIADIDASYLELVAQEEATLQ
jgi:hypothetical protein